MFFKLINCNVTTKENNLELINKLIKFSKIEPIIDITNSSMSFIEELVDSHLKFTPTSSNPSIIKVVERDLKIKVIPRFKEVLPGEGLESEYGHLLYLPDIKEEVLNDDIYSYLNSDNNILNTNNSAELLSKIFIDFYDDGAFKVGNDVLLDTDETLTDSFEDLSRMNIDYCSGIKQCQECKAKYTCHPRIAESIEEFGSPIILDNSEICNLMEKTAPSEPIPNTNATLEGLGHILEGIIGLSGEVLAVKEMCSINMAAAEMLIKERVEE